MTSPCPHTVRPAPHARAFTLVELLVVVALIGVLVALLLPAVQAARESARRTVCTNRLKQIALGLHEHIDAHRELPTGCVGCKPPAPAICDQAPAARLFTAWNVRLLPYLEQQPLADRYDDTQSAYAQANREVAQTLVEDYLCPSEPSEQVLVPFGTWRGAAYTDFGGVYGVEGPGRGGDECDAQTLAEASLGVMLYDDPTSLAKITDGATHTLAVAELRERRVAEAVWVNGNNVFAQEASTPVNSASGLGGDLGGPHPGGALGAVCDGSVRWLGESMPQPVLVALLTRAGEETTP